MKGNVCEIWMNKILNKTDKNFLREKYQTRQLESEKSSGELNNSYFFELKKNEKGAFCWQNL